MSGGPVQVPADCYIIVYKCTDVCGGEYLPLADDKAMDLHPSKEEVYAAGLADIATAVLWRHQCNKCGAQLKLADKYPKPAFIQRREG